MMTLLPTGEQLRDKGVAQVTANANLDDGGVWNRQARTLILELSANGVEFTAEVIRSKIGDPPRKNCMGALFLWGIRQGHILHVRDVKPIRASSHASKIGVYRRVVRL